MRTMQHLVAVVMLSGMLLFPSQSAQACHGRICTLCAGRGYGYANAGYVMAYGYTPNNSYMPSYNYGWGYSYPYWAYPPRPPLGSSDESQPRSSTTGTMIDRLADLEARVESINVSTHNRLLGLEGGLEKLRTEDLKNLTGSVQGLDGRLKKVEGDLGKLDQILKELADIKGQLPPKKP